MMCVEKKWVERYKRRRKKINYEKGNEGRI